MNGHGDERVSEKPLAEIETEVRWHPRTIVPVAGGAGATWETPGHFRCHIVSIPEASTSRSEGDFP